MAAGVRHLGRRRSRRRRPRRARPRRRPAARVRRRSSRRSRTRRHGTGRRSRSCRSPRRSSASTAGGSSRPSTGPAWPPRRRRRARAGGCCSTPGTRFPPDGPPAFTDEAALLEACTITVHAIPGEPSEPQGDAARRPVARVEQPLGAAGAPRVGFGHDSHPFGPGSPLRLGGIAIDGAPALAGHSDGDVVLHAVADALLGAAGLGDLGRLFPSDDAHAARHRQRRCCCATVVARLAAAGLRPGVAWTSTIIGARPRLGRRLDAMRAAIAGALGLDPARGQRQGLDRQPGRRRGRGPLDLRAGRRDRCGSAAT